MYREGVYILMNHALIAENEEDRIAQIEPDATATELGVPFLVVPPLRWELVDDSVTPAWSWNDGDPLPPPPDQPEQKSREQMIEAALIKKGIITCEEIDAEC